MKVQELIVTEVIQSALEDCVGAAAKRMSDQAVGCLVVTEDGAIKGIITHRDLLRCVGQGHDPSRCRVSTHMSRPVYVLGPEENLASAAEVMRRRRVKRLPIASNGKLLGIVSLSDLARFAASDLKASMRLICSLIEAPQTATVTRGL